MIVGNRLPALSAATGATESASGDDLFSLVNILWDAVQFSRTRGILVITCPENPAAATRLSVWTSARVCSSVLTNCSGRSTRSRD